METRASHVLVGLFVLVLGLATAAFGLWLGRAELAREVAVYEVEFRSAVTGLQNGAQVTYQGIPVGRVTGIGFDPVEVERVVVRVELNPTTPITADTTAQLAPQGITGIFFLQLKPGAPGSAPLPTTAAAPARIPGQPSAFDRLAADFPEVLAEGVVLLEQAVKLLDDANVAALSRTLANLETISEAVAERRGDVETLMADMTGLVAEVRGAADALVVLVDDAQVTMRVLREDVPTVLAGTNEGLAAFGAAARRMEAAAGQMDGLLRDVREPWRDFSRTGLYELNALIGETRILVASASRISREFERDPAGFLLGGSFKGFRAE